MGDAPAAALLDLPVEARQKALAQALATDEAGALRILSEMSGLAVLPEPAADTEGVQRLPARMAAEVQAIPVLLPGASAERLELATAWPPDLTSTAWAATFSVRRPRWHLAPADRVGLLIRENYGVGSGTLEEDSEDQAMYDATPVDVDADADAAVVRFVSDVLTQAVAERATDVHFEPQENSLRIRFRVDGILIPVPLPDNLARFQDAIISRLKIMARLNISERRLPQDGRIHFRDGTNVLDIRVSTIPTIYAESVSLRLLNQRKEAYDMDRVGLGPDEQAAVRRVLAYPHGIVLVTGPTGSGKSTTLNAFLREINSPDLRLVTIEDPIEYEVPGANQVQAKPEIGLTFAAALRSTLRQDPDVIMVGEIRDLETAEIAIRASLTGHLVFSTLHTNDAPGAITRLVDMGIEPFLVASAVELVIAQRLVRRLCPDCSTAVAPDRARLAPALAALGLPPSVLDGVKELRQPVGCRRCRGTGYSGRVGVFELFFPKPAHDLVVRRTSNRELTEFAVVHGMRPLAQSGWLKAVTGLTTVEELVRNIASNE
ncbi:MAG TPA: secretion system protein E [Opitutae bacterium]|nr:secretion system protein E [Opitutae bacterium]